MLTVNSVRELTVPSSKERGRKGGRVGGGGVGGVEGVLVGACGFQQLFLGIAKFNKNL
jgi:hypothetical protein